jgi:hypothetical protein
MATGSQKKCDHFRQIAAVTWGEAQILMLRKNIFGLVFPLSVSSPAFAFELETRG